MAIFTRRDIGSLILGGSACLALSRTGLAASATTPLSLARNGFYATTDTQAYHWCMANPNHPHQPAILQRIAKQPVACWVMEWGDTRQRVDNYLSQAMKKQQLGVFVAYNIPNRDMGQHSAGGAASAQAYAAWAETFAKAIGQRPCMVILEPDSLMHMAGKPQDAQKAQCAVLNLAIHAFATHAPNAWIYADGGSGDWPPAQQLAPLFTHLHWRKLRGFSLNVSNYNTDAQCGQQAHNIISALKKQGISLKHWVFDTSRNGNGPADDNAWCNPAGRKLGKTPSLGYMGADANLWIKLPGESDGECGAYPQLKAGAFSPVIAHNLIEGR